jgi:amino acid transporter
LHSATRAHFQPLFDHGLLAPLTAAALIFVAYEGFELIPNAVDEMENPQVNLKRALVIAILATTAIYVVVALAALGNLTPAQIEHDQEYVLAVAARPTLGEAGFVLIGIAALLSTASAINATLFGAARLAMVMANEHALPRLFSMRERVRPVPWAALVALTAASLVFALIAPLAVISSFASATFLLIFLAINLSAWRLRRRIGLAGIWPLAGALATATSFLLLMARSYIEAPQSLFWIVGFYAAAAAIEIALTLRRGPRLVTRTRNGGASV